MRKRHQYALLAVALSSATAFTFGGWAIVSVDEVPNHLVVGKPTELSFIVRQHGVSPMAALTPTVTLTSGSSKVSTTARSTSKRGYYVASLVAPAPGDWTARIETGFMNAQLKLLPTKAIAAGAPAPQIAEAELGHRLFSAKGCVSCHVRGGEGAENYKMALDLTERTYPADVLAKFLKDPVGNRISRVQTSNQLMPQLDLKDREIASLVAFINTTKQLSAK